MGLQAPPACVEMQVLSVKLCYLASGTSHTGGFALDCLAQPENPEDPLGTTGLASSWEQALR